MNKLGLVLLGTLGVLVLISQVGAHPSGVPRGVPTTFSGGALTSGISVSGACSTMASGDICCYDNNGAQCGFPLTDALADDFRIYGFSASPIGAGANLVGQDVVLAPGQGSMTLVATQANCTAGVDTVGVVVDGTTTTCTAHAATTSATLFACGTTNAETATNMAACLTQATGVDACAGAGCTLFTGVAGTAYVYRASDEPGGGDIFVTEGGDVAVAANGTDGATSILSSAYVASGSVVGFEGSAGNTSIAYTNSRMEFIEDGTEGFYVAGGQAMFPTGVSPIGLAVNGDGNTGVGGFGNERVGVYSGGVRALHVDNGVVGAGAHGTVIVDSATTFVATSSFIVLTCTGAETINTITVAGVGALAGATLVIEHTDTDCTIADDDAATAASAINLTGTATNSVGATAKFVALMFDGNAWQQVGGSANN